MFDGVTLATVIADAETVLTIIAPLALAMVGFWGGKKVWSLIRGATGR